MGNMWVILTAAGIVLLLLALMLKQRRRRIIVLSTVVAVLCLGYMLFLFVTGKSDIAPGNRKWTEARDQCRLDNKLENGFHLCFSGFDRAAFSDSVLIRRSNAAGEVLEQQKQLLDITTDGGFRACCSYITPIKLDDVLELTSGKQKYIIKGFVLQPFAGSTATGTVTLSGCVLDSAVVNGKKIKFTQQMEIHRSDSL